MQSRLGRKLNLFAGCKMALFPPSRAAEPLNWPAGVLLELLEVLEHCWRPEGEQVLTDLTHPPARCVALDWPTGQSIENYSGSLPMSHESMNRS